MIPEYTSCQEGCSGIPFFTVLMTVYRVTQRQATRSLYCHLKLTSTLTDEEVDILYEKYTHLCKKLQVSRNGLQNWYDGYFTASGKRLYNPRSVVMALRFNQLSNYWTSSGPYNEIFYYIRNDIDHIKNDLALMIAGGEIDAKIDEFAASAMELKSRDQIYSAMVVYGLLTYSGGKVLFLTEN